MQRPLDLEVVLEFDDDLLADERLEEREKQHNGLSGLNFDEAARSVEGAQKAI